MTKMTQRNVKQAPLETAGRVIEVNHAGNHGGRQHSDHDRETNVCDTTGPVKPTNFGEHTISVRLLRHGCLIDMHGFFSKVPQLVTKA